MGKISQNYFENILSLSIFLGNFRLRKIDRKILEKILQNEGNQKKLSSFFRPGLFEA